MTPNEVKKAHETGATVTALIGDREYQGRVRESGILSSRLGPGTVNRAVAIIETENGDFPVFFRDLK